MTYLVNPKPRRSRPGILTAERLRVAFADVMKPTGTTIGGLFKEVEKIGEDEQMLRIATPEALSAAGTKAYAGMVYVRRRASEINKHLRRPRDDDASTIEAYDDQIEVLREEIKKLRALRATAVKRAWTRGREVSLAEVVGMIEERT